MLKLGAPLRGLDNFDSYECRGRNRVRGATLSEHGRANALDVRAFKLANGEMIGLTDVNVAKAWREGIRASACARFSTVLGPGSDGHHEEHIHVDLAERRGGYKMCEWDVREPVRQAEKKEPPAEATTSSPASAPLSEPVPLPRPRPLAANVARDVQLRAQQDPRAVTRVAAECELLDVLRSSLRSSSDLAGLRRRYLPIITSDALMTAQASSPFCRARSATASLVIDAVTMTP